MSEVAKLSPKHLAIELAQREVLLRETREEAAEALGVTTRKLSAAVKKHSDVYNETAQDLLDRRAREERAVCEKIADKTLRNAYLGAVKHEDLLLNSEDEDILYKVGKDAMDRRGFTAPTKVQNDVRISLDPETAQIMREGRMKLARVIDGAAELTQRWSFALESPKSKDDDLSAAVGTKERDAVRPTEDPGA